MGHGIRFIPRRRFIMLMIEAILYPGIKITKGSVIILRFPTVVRVFWLPFSGTLRRSSSTTITDRLLSYWDPLILRTRRVRYRITNPAVVRCSYCCGPNNALPVHSHLLNVSSTFWKGKPLSTRAIVNLNLSPVVALRTCRTINLRSSCFTNLPIIFVPSASMALGAPFNRW